MPRVRRTTPWHARLADVVIQMGAHTDRIPAGSNRSTTSIQKSRLRSSSTPWTGTTAGYWMKRFQRLATRRPGNVIEWLKVLENNQERPAASQGKQPYDSRWMWDELKLGKYRGSPP